MSDDYILKDLYQNLRGDAPSADLRITDGMQDVLIGDVKGIKHNMHGSPIFYALLDQMAEIHNRKSHDYANNENPFANYEFAGKLSQLFHDSRDAGFIGRIGEKLYRLANLENTDKVPKNETVEDTENDLCVIMALWVASRRERRMKDYPKEPLSGAAKGKWSDTPD